MKNFDNEKIVRFLPQNHLKTHVLIAVAFLGGLFLTVSVLGFSLPTASAAETTNTSGDNAYRRAHTVDTWYHDNYVHTDVQRKNFLVYQKHMDKHFHLLTRERDNQLQLMIRVPPSYRVKQTRIFSDYHTINFRLRTDLFFYNTVRRPSDCRDQLFLSHYAMSARSATNMSLPLSASDYGRYYCFKIGLRVSTPGWDLIPYRVFVVDRAISSPGRGDKLADYPGFSRTVMQSTRYDYWSHLSHQPTPQQERWYRHLNDHFNLYSRYTSGRLDLRLTLPPSFDSGALLKPSVKKFEIKKMEYVALSNASSCDRPAFESGSTVITNPTTSMSLTPPSGEYGPYYCLKVTLRGKRSLLRDKHPYRIFLVPLEVGAIATDNIWQEL